MRHSLPLMAQRTMTVTHEAGVRSRRERWDARWRLTRIRGRAGEGDTGGMQRFDGGAPGLVVGERVRAEITSHERWGVMARVVGHEDLGASVDAAYIDSPSGSQRALPHEYPAIGIETDAVVQEIDAYQPPLWLRLTLREGDLRSFQWPCGFCALPAVVSAGGDGVSINVRSADGPGCASFVAHRACLVERLDLRFLGERARVAKVGRS
jgi:hypothetical protein